MTEFVRAYQGDEGNTLVSVPKAFAEGAGLHTVQDEATDPAGRPLPPSDGHRTSAKKAAKNTTSGGSSASTAEEASE